MTKSSQDCVLHPRASGQSTSAVSAHGTRGLNGLNDSMQPLRPTPRHLFLARDRQPLVYFYTSNLSKYLQAQVVFERAGLVLHHFKSRSDPYSEDYSLSKKELLARAIQQISGSVGSGS